MNYIEKYNILNAFIDKVFKDSMLSLDKEDNYYNVASVYHEVMLFLTEIKYIKSGVSKEQQLKLHQNNRKLKFIISEFEKNYYNDWINKFDYKIIEKSAAHYDRKLECYYRKFNFKILSHNDPFTNDEKMYCLEFNKDVFPELNYQKFEDIEINKIQMALNNLLSN